MYKTFAVVLVVALCSQGLTGARTRKSRNELAAAKEEVGSTVNCVLDAIETLKSVVSSAEIIVDIVKIEKTLKSSLTTCEDDYKDDSTELKSCKKEAEETAKKSLVKLLLSDLPSLGISIVSDVIDILLACTSVL